MSSKVAAPQVRQWDLFELTLAGPEIGNPFVDVELSGEFSDGRRVLRPDGFYDGDGLYRIRFMPDRVGPWSFVTHSNVAALDGQEGEFTAVAPDGRGHGPVRTHNRFHFAYADGTPYYPFGTTCYAWTHQGEAREEQTLATLAHAPFNKLRMCVFPKDYIYNQNEPGLYPFVRTADGSSNFSRFEPAFWRHLETRVGALRDLGIEADLIVLHPYDRWGYANMSLEEDVRYVRYLIARLAAYRNVWWSLANEYDFLLHVKPMAHWDRLFQLFGERDPYQHLRSIHNGDVTMNYDHTKPWVTHVCIQNWDVQRAREWRDAYGKPVIDDECEYEGNVPLPWGNITGAELVHRFWTMVCRGAYAGHGECYLHPDDVLWWSKGGLLHGESAPRIAFLRSIIEQAPAGGLEPLGGEWVWDRVSGVANGDYRLLYFGEHQPAAWSFGLPDHVPFTIDIIDTWAMTITRLPEIFQDVAEIPLPGRPWIAARIAPVREGDGG